MNDVLTELDRKAKRFKSVFGKNTINRCWKTLIQPRIFFLICMKGVPKYREETILEIWGDNNVP